jgi:hypothetical protein
MFSFSAPSPERIALRPPAKTRFFHTFRTLASSRKGAKKTKQFLFACLCVFASWRELFDFFTPSEGWFLSGWRKHAVLGHMHAF